MKEATARIKINLLLETAGWCFFPSNGHPANIQLEPAVTLKRTGLKSFCFPPLAVQKPTASAIEAEQALVASTRELITRFEKKIQAVLAKVWGE